jgi:hypothetical protein
MFPSTGSKIELRMHTLIEWRSHKETCSCKEGKWAKESQIYTSTFAEYRDVI